jgi:DNA repair exonuclease SbcCD ATPase subunit
MANINAIYSVLRKVEKSLSLLPPKCEDLNSLSLKSKVNYLNRETAKLRKELTRATKRLNDKDAFITKLKRENESLKQRNQKIAEENLELKKQARKTSDKFLELKLTHTLSLRSKDDNLNAYKKRMEEKIERSTKYYEGRLAQKDEFIEKLKSDRSGGVKGKKKEKAGPHIRSCNSPDDLEKIKREREEFQRHKDEHFRKSFTLHPETRALYEKLRAEDSKPGPRMGVGSGPGFISGVD